MTVVSLALGLRLLYGDGQPGYDSAYSLLWGRELADGQLPHFEVTAAPTPHPLAYVVSAALAPLGDAASDVMVALGFLSFGLLGWAALRLGASLFSPATGVVFAAMVLVVPQLVNLSLLVGNDLAFLALVLLACAAEAERPRQGRRVLVLLAFAGLLRPEAWMLSAAYLVYLAVSSRRPVAPRLVLLAASAPALWTLLDLLATGDPLYSLHATQTLAEFVERPRGLGSILGLGPSYLSELLGRPMLGLALVGFTFSCLVFVERWALPGTLVVLGLLSFAVLGVTGLPVLARYLLMTSVLLVLFAAVALMGWVNLERTSPLRTPWLVSAVVMAALAIAFAPQYRDRIEVFRERAAVEADAQADLKRLVRSDPVARTLARCLPVSVENFRLIPLLAYWLKWPARSINLTAATDRPLGVRVVLRPSAVLSGSPLGARSAPPDDGSSPAHESRYWLVYAACGTTARRG